MTPDHPLNVAEFDILKWQSIKDIKWYYDIIMEAITSNFNQIIKNAENDFKKYNIFETKFEIFKTYFKQVLDKEKIIFDQDYENFKMIIEEQKIRAEIIQIKFDFYEVCLDSKFNIISRLTNEYLMYLKNINFKKRKYEDI